MRRQNTIRRWFPRITLVALLLWGGIFGGASAVSGKTVTLAGTSDLFRIANPAIFRLSSLNYWWYQVFSGLVRPDGNFKVVPDLAKSWTVSEDKMTYIFNLRKGVRWHDGKPFTAEDVKFTYELMLNKDNRAASSHWMYFGYIQGAAEYRKGKARSIRGIEVLGPHKLRLRLNAPYAAFLIISAAQPIVPKHVLAL